MIIKTLNVNFIKTHKDAIVPKYAIEGAGCFDLYTIDNGIVRYTEPKIFDTGIAFEIPAGYVMLIFSRSGHGFDHGIRLANCVGVLDHGFSGSAKIKLTVDEPNKVLKVSSGDRIAQAMVLSYPMINFNEVSELAKSVRGLNGFGHTGK